MNFVAIDFETADHGRDSACAIGLVRVESGWITERAHRLIRPPRPDMVFSYIHGLSWDDVREAPVFAAVWHDLQPVLAGADFLVAHNAPFDRGVLRACCEAAGLPEPLLPWQCTVRMARQILGIKPANLRHVCDTLGIELRHHEALSDAEACARIMVRSLQENPRKADPRPQPQAAAGEQGDGGSSRRKRPAPPWARRRHGGQTPS